MALIEVESFASGHWIPPSGDLRLIADANTGHVVAQAGHDGLDFGAMRDFAKSIGGPALRDMTFHQRAKMIKALALFLSDHKTQLYDLSYRTGATLADSKIDIDGGIATLFVFASKGRREMPDDQVYLDGNLEILSRDNTFSGHHVCTPLQGVAVHINAYNFPVWGMLEKLAPTLLAGVPAIIKAATDSCYVAQACVRLMVDSGILPSGAIQFVAGGLGDLLNRLDGQDVVSFTGSAETALKLRSMPNLLEGSVRFVAEQDSLNACILGPDVTPDSPEFEIFINEVHTEMTTKAGQKCTAMRRLIVPEDRLDLVLSRLSDRLTNTKIGAANLQTTQMGALISKHQRTDVLQKIEILKTEADVVCGDLRDFAQNFANFENGAFVPPTLLHCKKPDTAQRVHDTEAFGPVATVMGYDDFDGAMALANRGGGSLVTSVITQDPALARRAVLGIGAFHGRIYFNNRTSAAAATGHGSPLPHLVHGGPGRAGGGEELGGVRGVLHYMQRTAIQGDPTLLATIGSKWHPGAKTASQENHPFTRSYDALQIGDTLVTDERTVTLSDIETFAHFTGDTFYAHMDDTAAKRNPFFPGRVAHGYLLLSFAAGLFVQPDEGPVLANTGLDNLQFMKPVEAGTKIFVTLTVKQKTPRTDEYGQIRWHVEIQDGQNDLVATYELLTMNAYQHRG